MARRGSYVVFGAQAVNAYVDEPRMTQDVDILSTRASGLAEELRERNRHLADVRYVDQLPPAQRIAEVWILEPPDLIAAKVMSCQRRSGRPKSFTDRRDVASLLLRFPELKREPGPVGDRLRAAGVEPEVLDAWRAIVASEILPEDDEY